LLENIPDDDKWSWLKGMRGVETVADYSVMKGTSGVKPIAEWEPADYLNWRNQRGCKTAGASLGWAAREELHHWRWVSETQSI